MSKKVDKTSKETKATTRSSANKQAYRSQRSKAPRSGDPNVIRKNQTSDFATSAGSLDASLLFPEECMSMKAFGNVINSPGQSNFIESWNAKFTQGGPIMPATRMLNSLTKRSCNAVRIDVMDYFGALASMTEYGTTTDPFQMAALNLKQFIDTSFGTKTDYDPQDLMLYLMGVSAVYSVIAEIKRDIRLTITYQQDVYPAYLPYGIFRLLQLSDGNGNYMHGEGATYAAKNLRGYVDQLNQVISVFNRLPMPPELKIFGYNEDLYDCIYMDTPDFKTAQLYIFRNVGYWEYLEDTMAVPVLRFHEFASVNTIGAKIDILRVIVERLTALRTSSTAMLQNLFNAYGSKDTLNVPLFDPANVPPLEFKYDEHILISLENATVLPVGNKGIHITDHAADPIEARIEGHLWFSPDDLWTYETWGYNQYLLAGALINVPLQFHKDWDQVSSEDIGWAMRFKPMLNCSKKIVVDANEYANPVGERATVDAYVADGYTGYGFLTNVEMAHLSDDGQYASIPYYQGINAVSTGEYPAQFYIQNDFKAMPVTKYLEYNFNTQNVALLGYDARRDVETTYRLEDINMFWRYLTLKVWAAMLNRNVTGTRTRYYNP